MSQATLFRRGLVSENPALVQLLGLCPLLAVSTSVVAGVGLAGATWAVMVISALLVSALRTLIPSSIRLPAFVVIIAAAVTAIDLILPIFLFELHRKLGLFIPLIVTNCVVLARVETFSSKQPLSRAMRDANAMACGFALALVLLGFVRELAGTGCVLDNISILMPLSSDAWKVCIFDRGLLIALLPPGAFFALGLLVLVWRAAFHRE